MEVWELAAREGIRDLVARYNANGDSGRFAQVLELFAPDAAMELVDAGGDVRAVRGSRCHRHRLHRHQGPVGRRGSGPPGRPHHVRHFVATHQIDVEDRTHASGRSYFAVLMAHGLDHWGRYLDRYEERDGRWLFTLRRALPDGRTEHAVDG